MDEQDDENEAKARVGGTINEYIRVDELLGVGGMGAVYRATNLRVDSEMALKILLRRFVKNREVRERFENEGRITNKVRHQGVVTVSDSGVTSDGCPFLVMEFLRGMSLQARWEAQGLKMDVRSAIEIAAKLLDVLATAHEAGVIHRDIKPDNIFLTDAGELKVLDFGIARHEGAGHGPRPSKTRLGVAMGTVGFMAPEQAMGRWKDVDARTDLWAVGATLFALLTGQTVDEQEGGGLLRVPPIESRLPDLDARVAYLVNHALTQHPAERWPDAATMRREAVAILASLPPSLPPSPPPKERERAETPHLASASTEPAGRQPRTTAPTNPGAPAGWSQAFAPPSNPGAPGGDNGADTAQISGRTGPSAQARTSISAPSEEALRSPVPPPATSPLSTPSSEPSKPPRSAPGKLRGAHVAALLLGVVAAGFTVIKVTGGPAGNDKPPREEDGGSTPVTTISSVPPDPTTPVESPPNPQALPIPTTPLYEGVACNDGGPIADVKEAEAINSKYCGGQCVSLGRPETGCKLGTCKSCNLPNAAPGCPKPGKAQMCIIGSCDKGYEDCDKRHETGCEIDLRVDIANCGLCGKPCEERAHAGLACADGKCSFTCDPGYGNCDNNSANGCEADLKSSLNHCGTCKNTCSSPKNASATCVAGECGFTCNESFDDCDHNAGNGCEVNLKTSVVHCGGCGRACPAAPNMVPSCSGGGCTPGSCRAGFKECDGDPSNGCEAHVGSDLRNCGDCGVPCTAPQGGSASCESGHCRRRCDRDSIYRASTNECIAPEPPPDTTASPDPDAGAPPPSDAGG
ncbi:MAG TPA: protein kinase [Polyangiaceae bacterium]|nr:protein kinase [Polyangiaceae bacterium]